MFSYSAIKGFNKLSVRQLLYLGYMKTRYHVSYAELVAYWNKHVGSWGGIAKEYKYVGFKDNKEVKTVIIGPSYKFDLKVSQNKEYLENLDTYDVMKLSLDYVDEHDTTMMYANKPLEIKVEGPVELIGPCVQNLIGGRLSIYIKSLGKKGKAKVNIKLEDIIKEISFEVR